MVKLVENVPEHILRDYVKIGQKVTILKGAKVRVQVPAMPTHHAWDDVLEADQDVVVVNFLPGYTEVYANRDGVKPIHNHQVVWIEKDREYHCADINNVKEVRDAD